MHHRSVRGGGDTTAAEAFAAANWKRLLPLLTRYAVRCMKRFGWKETERSVPAVTEARELVNRAVDAFLSERRTWVPALARTEAGLIAVLCTTIRSEAVNLRTSAEVAKKKTVSPDVVSVATTAETKLAQRALLDEIEEMISDDEDLVALYGAMSDGFTKEAELEAKLNWDKPKVKLVKRRLRNRLEARGMSRDGTREAGHGESKEDEEGDE